MLATVTIAGRRLRPTPVLETYWRFAAERQRIYLARLGGEPGPWTDDPILVAHRFTSCFRVTDRVSQYLVRHVQPVGSQGVEEVVFRTLLFKLFNRVSTWELLVARLGQVPTWAGFDHDRYDAVLGEAFASGQRLYSAAYVMPPPRLAAVRKHSNHLLLLAEMMRDDLPSALQAAPSMRDAFERLRSYSGIGDFLAFQYLIDLGYSGSFDVDESAFVVAGPGARDGIRKCFGPGAAGIEAEVIAWMTEHQEESFARLGLQPVTLSGRALQLVDCQNLFCEVDKYARLAHPEVAGISGRARIKQRFSPAGPLEPVVLPRHW
jgi:hypothetical protein